MIEAFQFVDGHRTFKCTMETPRRCTQAWWWFSVETKHALIPDGQRYAAFAVLDDDTTDSVRQRITRFHDELLVQRAQPANTHWRRGRAASTGTAGTAATAPAESATA